MSRLNWLPEPLHPVALRLARADHLAYELALVLLSWSRGTGDEGALTIRQVERSENPGYYDVEVAAVRPIPPVANMLFSEVINHLRAALDNVVYFLVEQEHAQPLTVKQAKAISMPISDDQARYDSTIATPIKHGLNCYDSTSKLGGRLLRLQPFVETETLPSTSRLLAKITNVNIDEQNPLTLLREYSNHDKHRALRVVAGKTLVQTDTDWRDSVTGGMRPFEVGTVLRTVQKGVPTMTEFSPALLVERPNGQWVAIGPELNGIASYISDIAIPTLVTGMALPGGLPVNIDLEDNGQTIEERADAANNIRAHERAQPVMAAALQEALQATFKWPETINLPDEEHPAS